MYIVYEEHIEQLELENEELKREVLFLKKKLDYRLSIKSRDRKKYFDKVVEWDKNLIKKFQDKFGLTDYQVKCIAFAKGFIIGALIF